MRAGAKYGKRGKSRSKMGFTNTHGNKRPGAKRRTRRKVTR